MSEVSGHLVCPVQALLTGSTKHDDYVGQLISTYAPHFCHPSPAVNQYNVGHLFELLSKPLEEQFTFPISVKIIPVKGQNRTGIFDKVFRGTTAGRQQQDATFTINFR